jgi:hypothetical protein
MNSGDLLHYRQIKARKYFVVLAPGLICKRSQLTSLLVTRPISNLSGKSIVLAMASTIRRDADFVVQSSKLKITSCHLVQSRSNCKIIIPD